MKSSKPSVQFSAFIRAAVLVGSLASASAAMALEIYKWEDETGQVHISDVVPNKYKKSATRIEVRGATEEPKPAATDATAKEKTKAAEPVKAAPEVPKKAAAPTSAAPAPASPKPAAAVETTADENDCATQLRLYRESQECFAPFRTATGGIRAEAFEKCKERPDPSERCPKP